MINYQELMKNEWFRMGGMLLLGITLGAVFYPTKSIEEKVSQKYEQQIQSLKQQHSEEQIKMYSEYTEKLTQFNNRTEEAEKKVTKLKEEVKTLQSKQKTAYYKLIKPDGTIEIKKFTENEVNESSKVVTQIQEEFKSKIEQIETKWSEIHVKRVEEIKKEFDLKESSYKHTINELEKSRKVTVNEKKFSIEGGILSNKDYYGHATMDLWGPVFLGFHGELGKTDNKLGAGLGLRF